MLNLVNRCGTAVIMPDVHTSEIRNASFARVFADIFPREGSRAPHLRKEDSCILRKLPYVIKEQAQSYRSLLYALGACRCTVLIV